MSSTPKRYSIAPLVAIIKRELKIRSLTYRDVARVLGVSENSIKLRFSHKSLSIEQVMAIADLLGLSMSELMRKVEQPPMRQLSPTQESDVLNNIRLLLVAVHIMDDWRVEDIVATYNITMAECVRHLLELERIGFIELLPNNVVRKRISRNLEWIPNGPFHRYIAPRLQGFLDHPFDEQYETRLLLRGSLTPVAIEQFQDEMRQLKQRLADLHEESLIAPFSQRRNFVVYMAAREWELDEFTALRRERKAP